MPIYTQFGSEVALVAYLGEDDGQNAFSEDVSGVWVTVRYVEPPISRPVMYRDFLVADLRADDGYSEILAAVDALSANEPGTGSEYDVETLYGCESGDDWLAFAGMARDHELTPTQWAVVIRELRAGKLINAVQAYRAMGCGLPLAKYEVELIGYTLGLRSDAPAYPAWQAVVSESPVYDDEDDDPEEREADLVAEAQEQLAEVIAMLKQAQTLAREAGFERRANWAEAYILSHLSITRSADHGYLSRSENLDDWLRQINDGE